MSIQPLLQSVSKLQYDVPHQLGLRAVREPIKVFLFEQTRTYRSYLGKYFPDVPRRRALFVKQRGPGMVFAHLSKDIDVIDGALSHYNVAGADIFVSIGRLGMGSLTLSNDATMDLVGAGVTLDVGRELGAIGTLEILTGAELLLDGTTDATRLRIGRSHGSNGSVLVQGTGSLLTVTGTNASFGDVPQVRQKTS